jgi:hypothetical protein
MIFEKEYIAFATVKQVCKRKNLPQDKGRFVRDTMQQPGCHNTICILDPVALRPYLSVSLPFITAIFNFDFTVNVFIS